MKGYKVEMGQTNKQSQATVFIIMGLIILVSFFVFYMLNQKGKSPGASGHQGVVELIKQKESFSASVSNCLKDALEEGAVKEGIWSETILKTYVENQATTCLSALRESFQRQGIDLTAAQPEVSIVITKDMISAHLIYPVTLSSNGEKSSVNDFTQIINRHGEAKLVTDGEGIVQEELRLFSPDLHAHLLIPKGIRALDKDGRPLKQIQFYITENPRTNPNIPGGILYDFRPNGAVFTDPGIELTLFYDESFDAESFRIAWQTPEGHFETLPTKVYPEKNKIVAYLTHFSVFGLKIIKIDPLTKKEHSGTTCEESDGGDDKVNRGTSYEYTAKNGQWMLAREKTDTCQGDNLIEFYCLNDKIEQISIDCSCRDGECISSSTQPNSFSSTEGLAGNMHGPNHAIPSVQGFHTDLQTGSASQSIPITVPKGISGLTPSLLLSYSSGVVDSNRVGIETNNEDYYRQASEIGYGWSLAGLGVITRDMGLSENNHLWETVYGSPGVKDDRFYLSFPGGTAELIYKDGIWQTNPNLTLKIEHTKYCGDGNPESRFSDGDEWVITSGDGTKYYFGNPSNKNREDCELYGNENQELPEALEFDDGRCTAWNRLSDQDSCCLDYPLEDYDIYTQYILINIDRTGSNDINHYRSYLPVNWYLRKVEDVFGNSIDYAYKARAKEICWPDGNNYYKENNYYVRDMIPDEITYNKGKTRIDFVLAPRAIPQYYDENTECNDDHCIEHWKDWSMFGQVYWSSDLLDRIDVLTQDGHGQEQRVRSYELSHDYTFKPSDNEKNERSRLLILTSVQEFGRTQEDYLPPTNFSYDYVKSRDGKKRFPNLYLTAVENNYGARIDYHYKYSRIRSCTDRIHAEENGYGCGEAEKYGVFRYLVDYIITSELSSFPEIKSYKTSYDYEGYPFEGNELPYAHAKRIPAHRPENFQYLGFSAVNTSISEFNVFNYYDLGYPDVTRITAEGIDRITDFSRIASKSRTEFYTKIEQGNCFNPDARKGQVRLEQVFEVENGVPSSRVRQENAYSYAPELDCSENYNSDKKIHSILLKKSTSKIDGESSIIKYGYGEANNLRIKVEEGDENDTTDDRSIEYLYFPNKDQWLLHYPAKIMLKDYQQKMIFFTENYYDNHERLDEPAIQGLITKQVTGGPQIRVPGSINRITRTSYTSKGYPERKWDAKYPDKPAVSIVYDDFLGMYPISVRNALEHPINYTYDFVIGRPLSSAAPLTKTQNHYEDELLTSYKYDGLGRLIKVIRQGQDSEENPQLEYIYKHNLQSGNDIASSNWYCPFQRMWPGLIVTTKTKLQNNRYKSMNKFYDGLGNQVRTDYENVEIAVRNGPSKESWKKYKANIIKLKEYNSLGQEVKSYLPFESSVYHWNMNCQPPEDDFTEREYDVFGYMKRTIDPMGRISTQSVQGYKTVVKDPGNNIVKTIKDAYGREVQVEIYNKSNEKIYKSIRRYYDVLDRVIKTAYFDGNGNLLYETHKEYNPWGQVIFSQDPDLGARRFDYDANGNVEYVEDEGSVFNNPNHGKKSWFAYDRLNRLTSISHTHKEADASVINTYDLGRYGLGNKVKMDDESGYTEYIYDSKGRLFKQYKSIKGYNPLTFTYEYNDEDDSLKALTYPGGERILYEYDDNGRLRSLKGNDTYQNDVYYDHLGNLIGVDSNAVISTQFAYNKIGRLTNKEAFRKPWHWNSLYFNKNYEYDITGNIVLILDSKNRDQSFSFRYDNFNKLVEADNYFDGTVLASYNYDNKGNLMQKNEAEELALNYDDIRHVHAPSSVIHNGQAFNYTYDGAGNLFSYLNLEGDSIFIRWNYNNKPAAFTIDTPQGRKILNMTYDGEGNLVKKSITIQGETTTTYYFDNYEVELKSDGTSKETLYYPTQGASAFRKDGELFFSLKDHLGSTSLIVDKEGERVAGIKYYPYGQSMGEERYKGTRLPSDRKFTGQRYELFTGLYDFGSRYYHPLTGRFISPDTIEGPNRYAYANNNPLRFIDVSGTQADEPESGNIITRNFKKYAKKIMRGSKRILFGVKEWTWDNTDFSDFYTYDPIPSTDDVAVIRPWLNIPNNQFPEANAKVYKLYSPVEWKLWIIKIRRDKKYAASNTGLVLHPGDVVEVKSGASKEFPYFGSPATKAKFIEISGYWSEGRFHDVKKGMFVELSKLSLITEDNLAFLSPENLWSYGENYYNNMERLKKLHKLYDSRDEMDALFPKYLSLLRNYLGESFVERYYGWYPGVDNRLMLHEKYHVPPYLREKESSQ